MARIWVDGCFDLFHYGHANAIRQARELGEYLIAGCHSDEAIELNKGPPVLPEEERVRLVRACRWVSEVVPDAPYVTEVPFVKELNINYVVHGDDISTDMNGEDTYRLVKAEGLYKECRRTPGVSTTDAVSRILFGVGRPPLGDDIDETLLTAFAQDPDHPNQAMILRKASQSNGAISAASPPTRQPSSPNPFIAMVAPLRPHDRPIYVDGPFDLFSAEDVDFLEKLAADISLVIVGVWGSDQVRRATGADPVLSFQERALSILQCKYVHGVILPAVPAEQIASLLGSIQFEGPIMHVARHRSSQRAIERIEQRRSDFEDRQRRKEGKTFVEAALKKAQAQG